MRAVLVESQALLRDALISAITERGVEIVGQARDERSALKATHEFAPDVVLLGARLPPSFTDEGIRIAERIRAERPDTGLLVLGSVGEVSYAQRLLTMQGQARAVGYLIKDSVSDLDHLVDTMGRVAAGEVVLTPQIVDQLMAARDVENPLTRLTAHELRVLSLVAEGRSNPGIAGLLECQVSTVEKHLTAITAKLGLPGANDPGRSGVNVRVLAALAYLRDAAEGRVLQPSAVGFSRLVAVGAP